MTVITDATLCTIQYEARQAKEVRALYLALLELGMSFIQIPVRAAALLGDCLIRERTVLSVSVNDEVPKGFAGYICEAPVTQEHSIGEVRLGDRIPDWADEVRVTADAALFMRDYHSEFAPLLSRSNVTFCARDAEGAGTALAVEWLLSGGERAVLSFLGSGGYAPLEQVLAALLAGGWAYRLKALSRVADAWERLTGQRIPGHCPVVGRRIFDVESGTHADGILKNSRCYEPFSPEDVGGQRRVVIGKHSGRAALARKLEELGIGHGGDMERLLELVREASMQKGGSLSDGELKALAARAGGEDAA